MPKNNLEQIEDSDAGSAIQAQDQSQQTQDQTQDPSQTTDTAGASGSSSANTQQSATAPSQNAQQDTTQQLGQTSDPNAEAVDNYLPPDQDAIKRNLDHIAFSQDLDNGLIKPETYHSLFAKKDTLGKIGTIFGLMVGGAGAGLSHQPNLLAGLMQKEIDNDLDAQKTNQANKRSWYSLAMQQQNNLSNQNLQAAQTAATGMGTYGQSLDNMIKNHAIQLAHIHDLTASTDAKAAMTSALLHSTQSNINMMPNGPAKVSAQAQFDSNLKPQMMNTITGNEQQLAQKKNLLNAVAPNPMLKIKHPPDPRGPVANMEALKQRLDLSRLSPNMPGAIDSGTVQKEIGDLQANRNSYANAIDKYNQIAKLKNAGQVPWAPVAKAAITGAGSLLGAVTGGLLGAATAGSVSSGIGNAAQEAFERKRNAILGDFQSSEGLTESEMNKMMPSYQDDDNGAAAYRSLIDHYRRKDIAPILEINHLKTPFPIIPYVPNTLPTSQAGPKQKKSGSNREEVMKHTPFGS